MKKKKTSTVAKVGKNKQGKEKQHSVADRARQISERKKNMKKAFKDLGNS